jgi:hypothetical protein
MDMGPGFLFLTNLSNDQKRLPEIAQRLAPLIVSKTSKFPFNCYSKIEDDFYFRAKKAVILPITAF